MPSCWEEAVSALYIGLTGRYRLTCEDRTMEAQEQLARLMKQLEARHDLLSQQVATTRSEALAFHRANDRTRARARLVDHRRVRAQLQRVAAYQDMVNQHVDALRNTELNKSLITTLQESSRTLKALGVMDGVKQAEMVVQDVEKSMLHVQELTSMLGAPLATTASLDMDAETELEQELETLLYEDNSDRPAQADTQASSSTRKIIQPQQQQHADPAVQTTPPETPGRVSIYFDDLHTTTAA